MDAALVKEGQPVKSSVEGLPGKKFESEVTRFSYALDEATKTMLAEIELANPNLELRPGMYATVKIGIEHKENALLLPAGAVLAEKAGTSIFVVNGNKAKKTKVQIGFNDGKNIEILNGASPDQQVILVGKQAIADGQAISVSEEK